MPVVNREVVLPVPRERAWELVTEPEELETWLADDVEFEAEEGAPLRTEDDGEVREGVVEHVEAEERIVFTWGESMVEWRLDDHPDGTRFVVTEHRFAEDGDVWGPRLQALAAAALPGVDDRIGAVFAALADPTRRQVVLALSRQPELTASRLAGELPMTRQAVTKHLAALDRAGLVERPPRGARGALHAHARAAGRRDAWMDDVGAQWDDRLARLAERR